ncbi:MAG: hypothetical protein LBQ59_03425 [Candidatus Peribacteria bacterium]|nr:hypothetical protein [Candidatus Peribacteria bacterium]
MIHICKEEIESIRANIDIQEIYALKKIFIIQKEILKKQEENIFKEEEIFNDLNKLLEEIIKTEEKQTIRIAFF